MMHENVTKTCKKCNTNKSNSINLKAKQIPSKLKTDDRVQKLDENEAHVTIKDHKEGFPNKISCRLITLSKISKNKKNRKNRKNKQTNII